MADRTSGVERIRFQQSGGFAGLIRGADIALADLPPADRARLEDLIQASGLGASSAPGRSSRAAAARDAEEIEIEIQRGGKSVRHAFSELDLPEKAAPLVEWLRKKARPQRPA
jgi:hypothetical protein